MFMAQYGWAVNSTLSDLQIQYRANQKSGGILLNKMILKYTWGGNSLETQWLGLSLSRDQIQSLVREVGSLSFEVQQKNK